MWGLRRMRTAPGSLGVPLFGHTFALARAVGRYPCTWDLFSVWAQATAPVCAPFSSAPRASERKRRDRSRCGCRYSWSSAR